MPQVQDYENDTNPDSLQLPEFKLYRITYIDMCTCISEMIIKQDFLIKQKLNVNLFITAAAKYCHSQSEKF